MQKVQIVVEPINFSLFIFKKSSFCKILGLQIISWDLDLGFRNKEKYFRVNFNNIDITNQLYTEDIGQQASIVSQYSLVREALLVLQHSCVSKPGLIANGRDMGTKVFPGAKLKIFMTASIEVRAERRYRELIASGLDVKLTDIQNKIAERDDSDKNRDISPLKLASDAHIIDSTDLNLETILDKILELYNI